MNEDPQKDKKSASVSRRGFVTHAAAAGGGGLLANLLDGRTEGLHAEPLGVAVAAVAARTLTLFVRHLSSLAPEAASSDDGSRSGRGPKAVHEARGP